MNYLYKFCGPVHETYDPRLTSSEKIEFKGNCEYLGVNLFITIIF